MNYNCDEYCSGIECSCRCGHSVTSIAHQIEILKAFDKGKTIECRAKDQNLYSSFNKKNLPTFQANFDRCEYRIKKEPRSVFFIYRNGIRCQCFDSIEFANARVEYLKRRLYLLSRSVEKFCIKEFVEKI